MQILLDVWYLDTVDGFLFDGEALSSWQSLFGHMQFFEARRCLQPAQRQDVVSAQMPGDPSVEAHVRTYLVRASLSVFRPTTQYISPNYKDAEHVEVAVCKHVCVDCSIVFDIAYTRRVARIRCFPNEKSRYK